jgi:Beta protein
MAVSRIRYVPLLKGKSNDVKAYARLSAPCRSSIKPLFDLPFFGPSANVDEVISEFIDRVASAVPVRQPCFVDFYPFQDNSVVQSGQLAIVDGLNRFAARGLGVTPTLGAGRESAVFKAARQVVNRLGQGICLRVDAEAIDGQTDQVVADVDDRLALLGIPRGNCDLLLDCRAVARLQFSLAEVILDFLAVLRQGGTFRAIVIAGSSALADVSVVSKDGLMHVTRTELALWDRIVFELAGTLVPIFGDYGVVNPEFFADGPRPNANAKIRYTNGSRTTYFRGHGLYRPVTDFQQYRTLAAAVTAQQYYDGPGFCFGDAYIAQVATAPGPRGFGNLGPWVLADTNRHLSFVSKQLENRSDRILAAGSLAEVISLSA